MAWIRTLTLVALLVACTKPNEAKQCMDGTCTTPDFPFCDETGFVSDEPGTCIAVTCTAAAFGECRGDAEVRCNAEGTNYDVVQCERGCDASADGCRLCDPNETACTNGQLATCNASGAVVAKKSCPLGCFEDQPRCRDIAPSNDLAKYLDMVPNPIDLDLSNATIETITGTVTTGSGSMTVSSFLAPAPANGVPIRVIVAGRVRLGNVSVVPSQTPYTEAPALAILASGEITVDGRVDVADSERAAAGSVAFASCRGGTGYSDTNGAQTIYSGDGGGGHATPGSSGGAVSYNAGLAGGAGGSVSGTETLVPLRGGCAGSAGAVSGGGALQLTSRESITITGVINANGGPGASQLDFGPGGGAGGGILIEAPSVTLGAQARLLANGGGGASIHNAGMASESLTASMGGACNPASQYCGAGGNGAAVGTAATDGGSAAYTSNTAVTFFTGGGGGGGLGRLRINSRDSAYTKASSAIEAAAVTTGTISTR